MPRLNFGVGIDLEEVSRFEKVSRGFIEKIFTRGEIEYCKGKARPSQHFAARFAAKEAVIKCFGSLGKRILMDRIEVVSRGGGAPAVRILDESLRGYEVRLSLSHTREMAAAFAVVWRDGDG